MRLVAALLLCTFAAPACSGEETPRYRYVDLTAPEALKHLALHNPRHFQVVTAMLQSAGETPACAGTGKQLLEAIYKVSHVQCGRMVLTSFPSKQRIDFILDDTHYSGLLRQKF